MNSVDYLDPEMGRLLRVLNGRPLMQLDQHRFLIGSHRGARDLLRSSHVSSQVRASETTYETEWDELSKDFFLFQDGDDHRQVRQILMPELSARRSAEHEGWLREEARALKNQGTQFDLVLDVAVPLTTSVLERVIGVPAEVRREVSAFCAAMARPATDPGAVDVPRSAASRVTHALSDIASTPGALPPGVLRTLLGSGVPTRSAVASCALLVFAGFETTLNLFATAAHAALSEPTLLAALRSHSDRHARIDELIRLFGPAGLVQRRVLDPIAIDNHELQADTRVLICLPAANRDQSVFPNPDAFDPLRNTAPHLSFAHGAHYCLGAELARVQMTVLVEEILLSDDELSLVAGSEPRWADKVLGRGLDRIMVCRRPAGLADGRI